MGFNIKEFGDFSGIVEYFWILLLFVVGSFDERNRICLEFFFIDKVFIFLLNDFFFVLFE